MTALAEQRHPLPAKRNGALVARQRRDCRKTGNSQRQSLTIDRVTRKSKHLRTAIAPFRLASLSNRKQHVFPTPTTLPRKRCDNWPNGTSASQGQAATNSNCTIPFGHPPKPKTTRIADNHHSDRKKVTNRPNGNSNPQEQEVTEKCTSAPPMNASFHTIRLVCGVRGAGMDSGEGIIAFAAKRGYFPDGRAPGIEAVRKSLYNAA